MTTNDTTASNTDWQLTASSRSRIAAVALAIAAISGLSGFAAASQQSVPTTTVPVAAASPADTTAANTVLMNRALARFAAENNLTGLSAVSLAPVPCRTLAQFAQGNNLTGLSPASLAPIAVNEEE